MRRYWTAIIGNVLEHYDQALYGFLIPFLAPLFFPHEDPIYSLLAAFALLPLSSLSRPLGAYVFGRIGDRWGRARSLSLTLMGMAAATMAMGCLPTYSQAGWAAPALLTLCRLLQSFFVSGENTGGALFLLEETRQKQRGLMSSLFDASGVFGILLAAGMVSLGIEWRHLFWAGGFCCIAGLIVRRQGILDLPREKHHWNLQWSDWRPILTIAAVSGYSYANYTLLTSFLNGFLPLVSQVGVKEALALNTLLLAVDLFLLPCFGALSLVWGKERLMIAATLLAVCLSLPLFILLDGATALVAGGVRIAFTIIGVCLSAPFYAWAMEMAPPERRFTVCALASAIGGRAIGAPMPAIALWLYQQTGWIGSPALVLVALAAVACGVLSWKKAAATATP